MPQWSSTPPEDTHGPSLPLRRTPAAAKLEAIATSENLLGCPTHYFRSRTIPCERPECEPCAQGFSWRWHGYVAAVDTSSHEHFIFECTAAAAETFAKHRDRYGSLRGCHFRAERPSKTPNGRVVLRAKPADLAAITLPGAPDLMAALAHIWNIPKGDTKSDRQTKGHPRLDIVTAEGNNHPAEPSPATPTR